MAGEFPFVAKIIYRRSSSSCTGTLIAPDKVLTAGHCVSGRGGLSVGFGNSRTLEPSYPVASAILHPEYSTQVNDIAILRLEAAVPIQPVRILTLEEELQYAPSGAIWGTDQIGVEIQHKDRLLADQGAIEDVLAVENDVVPFDRADVLEQGRVDAFLCDSLRAHRLRDLDRGANAHVEELGSHGP